jgi:hypothetical protein
MEYETVSSDEMALFRAASSVASRVRLDPCIGDDNTHILKIDLGCDSVETVYKALENLVPEQH